MRAFSWDRTSSQNGYVRSVVKNRSCSRKTTMWCLWHVKYAVGGGGWRGGWCEARMALNCALMEGMWLVVLIVFEFPLRESRMRHFIRWLIRTSRKLKLNILYCTVQYKYCTCTSSGRTSYNMYCIVHCTVQAVQYSTVLYSKEVLYSTVKYSKEVLKRFTLFFYFGHVGYTSLIPWSTVLYCTCTVE